MQVQYLEQAMQVSLTTFYTPTRKKTQQNKNPRLWIRLESFHVPLKQ